MRYSQHLPNYIHNFEAHASFITRESQHYIFHFFADSVAYKDIEDIIITQENAYLKILKFLNIAEPVKKIEYFFYPDEATKRELMGDDWYAQSIYNEFRVHTLYTDTIKPIGPHEDTHLLSLPWGLSFGFMQEGLAEYMVGNAWDGTPFKKYAQNGYSENLYPTINTFFRHEAWLETDDSKAIYFYSLAGAFSTYLIEMFGKVKYELFYKSSKRESPKDVHETLFHNIFELSITDAELQFKDWINK